MASSEPILEVERSDSFTDDLLHGLWEMKSSEEMTDFNIKVNNDVIPCHSNVMATASPYFKRFLCSALFTAHSLSTLVTPQCNPCKQYVTN